MTNADRIQHALEEARGIDTPAAMNKIRKEIATDLQNRHGDWSVNPHLEDQNILVGVGAGTNRQVFKITVEPVAHGSRFGQ
jgi:hypothetical protein